MFVSQIKHLYMFLNLWYKLMVFFMHTAEASINVGVILTARQMSATAIGIKAVGVSVNPIVVTNLSTNC